MLGCFWLMLVPLPKPKRTFFLFSVVKCILLCSLIMGTFMGSWVQPLFCLIMAAIGFTKSVTFLPAVYVSTDTFMQPNMWTPKTRNCS